MYRLIKFGSAVIYFLMFGASFGLSIGNSDMVSQMNEDNVETPYGQLGDCPGSLKPVVISKKSLKYMTISVQGPGAPYVAKFTTYNYFQMHKILKDPMLDFSKRTLFFVGGYTDSAKTPIARIIGMLYNDLNYNVLLLDLNRFTTYQYPAATRYIRQASFHVAEMLVNLTSEGLDLSKLDILGLSLGGQTIGFIGKHYYALTGRKLGRLTALDPSGPCFRHLPPSQRLDHSDAEFVDVIYTNIDGWGIAAPSGHVNIYVNGGEFQPGDIIPLYCNIFCSHSRVYFLWISALFNPNKFLALKCDSVQQARNHDCYDRVPLETNILGLNVNRSNPGIYYLATTNFFPFYLGKKGLRKEYQAWYFYLKEFNVDDLVVL